MSIEQITITRRGGCILVAGSLSASMLKALTEEAPKGAVIDPDVARLAGVTWAFGLPDDLKRLRDELAAQTPRQRYDGLSEGAIEWLTVGQQGISSASLFFKATGVRPGVLHHNGKNGKCHPRDPADLNRCILLIEMAPDVAAKLPLMREVSPEWAVLVDHWDEIVATFHGEVGPNWSKAKSAPLTYALMKSLLDGVTEHGGAA